MSFLSPNAASISRSTLDVSTIANDRRPEAAESLALGPEAAESLASFSPGGDARGTSGSGSGS